MKTHKLKEEILFWLTVEASFHSQLAPMQLSMAEKHGRRKGTQVVAAAQSKRDTSREEQARDIDPSRLCLQ